MDLEKLGRYSFMGADPFLVLKSRGENVTVAGDGSESVETGNPLDVLDRERPPLTRGGIGNTLQSRAGRHQHDGE